MARAWPWLLVALALAPAWLVHAGAPASLPTSATAHQVSVAVFDNPNSVEPAVATTLSGRMVADNVFQTLFRQGPHGSIRPDLAESALVSGTSVTVVLSSARLTNGQPVTASMVKQALSYALSPAVHSSVVRRLLADVVGAGRVERGLSSALAGLSIVGRHRLVFHLKSPSAEFLDVLANPALGIVPLSDVVDGGPYWQTTNLFGSGGYQLTEWEPDALMDFQHPGRPLIEVARYSGLKEAWHAFQNGQVAAMPVATAERGQLPAAARRLLRYLPTGGQLELMIHPVAGSPWAVPHLARKRLDQVGLERLVRTALGGHVPAATHVPALTGGGATGAGGAGPLPVLVDASNPEALALGQALVKLAPHGFTVTDLSASTLRAEWSAGAVSAVLVPVMPNDPWTPPSGTGVVTVRLAPTGALWLLTPSLRGVEVYSDGALDWSTVP